MKLLHNLDLHLSEKQHMIQRFPKNIKLSYETVAHKKVSNDYNICIAVPYGRKAYLWWTYYKNNIVCCLLELNRTNVIGENVSFVKAPMPHDFELGTIVSGIIVEDTTNDVVSQDSNEVVCLKAKHFLVEDIYMYQGIVINKFQPLPFQKKIHHIVDFFRQTRPHEKSTHDIFISFHTFWRRNFDHDDELVPENVCIPYNIRFIQFRNTDDITPHVNVSIHKKPVWNPIIVSDDMWDRTEKPCVPNWTLDLYKPHYNQCCLFWVRADISYDVYYLYAKDPQRKPSLYQYAFIPNYKTSVMMNAIFRNIKENNNIDYIEESDDEEVYEDIRRDKFVDLQKNVLMECRFDRKFRKWVPLREASANLERYVPYMNQLVIMKTNKHTQAHRHHSQNAQNAPKKTHPQNYKGPSNRPGAHRGYRPRTTTK